MSKHYEAFVTQNKILVIVGQLKSLVLVKDGKNMVSVLSLHKVFTDLEAQITQ